MSTEFPVYDVDASSFGTSVIDRSWQVPVMVDFWAAWCGPCRILGPVLERVSERLGGQVTLDKLDVDANPAISAEYGVRSLPTVILFKDGEEVDRFVGARSESAVEAFLEPYVSSSVAKQLAEAEELARSGKSTQAVELLEKMNLEFGEDPRVGIALAEQYLSRGDAEKARSLYDKLPANVQTEDSAKRVHAKLQFAELLVHAPSPSDLADRVGSGAANEDDVLELAAYDVVSGRYTDAMETLLQSLRTHREWERAKKGLISVFDLAGQQTPEVASYRRKLAALLY